MDEIEIYCPECRWEPDGRSYWQCSCGTNWDTFSTGGRCPACGHVWKDTQCVPFAGGCGQWSPHLHWYHGLDKVLKETEEILGIIVKT